MLRVGIIGLGRVGKFHLEAYKALPGVKVAAVYDPTIGGTWHEVTESPEIDAVSICSPDNFHVEQAVSALNHGKHVMVEKPAALTKQSLAQLRAAHEKSGKLLTSNYVLRSIPAFRQLKEEIKSGEYGDLLSLEGGYYHNIEKRVREGWRGQSAGYTSMLGGGIHIVDLILWLTGEELVAQRGTRTLLTSHNSLYFASGTLANVTALFRSESQAHALRVYGTKKTFRYHEWTKTDKGALIPGFVQAIRNGHEPDVTARNVFASIEACL